MYGFVHHLIEVSPGPTLQAAHPGGRSRPRLDEQLGESEPNMLDSATDFVMPGSRTAALYTIHPFLSKTIAQARK